MRSIRTMVFLLSMVLCGFLAAAEGFLWGAVSKTATAITGDITVYADSIRFGNGVVITFEKTERQDVFKLDGSNPVLLYGNRLCGERTAPTYVTFYRDKSELALAVFNGEGEPDTPRQLVQMLPGMCASFFYERF